jgi:aryl carrier-like protein
MEQALVVDELLRVIQALGTDASLTANSSVLSVGLTSMHLAQLQQTIRRNFSVPSFPFLTNVVNRPTVNEVALDILAFRANNA